LDEGFLAMPSMAIKGNRVVVAVNDTYELLELDGKLVPPERLAQGLFEHFDAVHILDVDGYLKDSPHLGFIQKTCEMGSLWVDGGSRIGEGVIDLMMAGSAMAIVCSKSVDGLREVVNAYELSEDLVFQIDHKKGVLACNKAMAKMSLDDIIAEVMDIGISKFILADYAAMEKNKGPDIVFLKKIKQEHPGIELFAAGGVKAKHVDALKEAGFAGAILDLRSCIELKNITF
jgi:phosphoribosylformimino-5-aminoimidazole carboxamide ribonucleotide (ProFAR) isomerase